MNPPTLISLWANPLQGLFSPTTLTGYLNDFGVSEHVSNLFQIVLFKWFHVVFVSFFQEVNSFNELQSTAQSTGGALPGLSSLRFGISRSSNAAYAAFMRGNVHLEREQWGEALSASAASFIGPAGGTVSAHSTRSVFQHCAVSVAAQVEAVTNANAPDGRNGGSLDLANAGAGAGGASPPRP